MKVTIELTQADLKTLIAKQLGLENIDFTYTLVNSFTVFRDIDALLASNQKIAAIKALRAAVGAEKGYIGLADAKLAVENFEKYKTDCSRAGKLLEFPVPNGNYE